MVTGGASGALRQEFRELEVLDDVVQLRYEGKLPITVVGDRRHTLLYSFRSCKGENYVPANVHKAIRWTRNDPFPLDAVDDKENSSLNLVSNTQKGCTGSTKVGSTATSSSAITLVTSKITSLVNKVKRKLDNDTSDSTPRTKRVKFHHQTEDNEDVAALMPPGTTWSNNSCAYDATIVILHSIWLENPEHYTELLRSLSNQYLTPLLQRFSDHKHDNYSL
jgi:hypothetical protein